MGEAHRLMQNWDDLGIDFRCVTWELVNAGLPGYTEEQSIRLLTEGLTRDGRRPDNHLAGFSERH